MAILSLLAKLGLDKSGFDAGIDSAGKSVNSFATSLKTTLAGAFSTAAITAFVVSIGNTVNRIKDLSEQFSVTTDEVQETDFALKQSGLQFEDLGQAINKLGMARRDAVEGNKELRETFQRYGVTLQQLNDPQVRTYDILLSLAKATANQNMTAKQQVELMDLLGGRAGKLINVLKDLENVKPPAIINERDIEQIDRATKSLEALKLQTQAQAAPVVAFGAQFLRGVGAGAGALFSGEGKEGGLKGRFAAANKAFDQAVLNPILKDVATGIFGKPIAQAIGNIVNAVVPPAKQTLFKEDADVKAGKTKSGSAFTLQSDQFQRIGAFTGGAAKTAQESLLRDLNRRIEDMNRNLQTRGVLIRGEL